MRRLGLTQGCSGYWQKNAAPPEDWERDGKGGGLSLGRGLWSAPEREGTGHLEGKSVGSTAKHI